MIPYAFPGPGLPHPIAHPAPQNACLIYGRVGVNVGELVPCNGQHLRRGVELHGAAPERDHRVHQGQVLVLQLFDVPVSGDWGEDQHAITATSSAGRRSCIEIDKAVHHQ